MARWEARGLVASIVLTRKDSRDLGPGSAGVSSALVHAVRERGRGFGGARRSHQPCRFQTSRPPSQAELTEITIFFFLGLAYDVR